VYGIDRSKRDPRKSFDAGWQEVGAGYGYIFESEQEQELAKAGIGGAEEDEGGDGGGVGGETLAKVLKPEY